MIITTLLSLSLSLLQEQIRIAWIAATVGRVAIRTEALRADAD